jgi:hypothetical protein
MYTSFSARIRFCGDQACRVKHLLVYNIHCWVIKLTEVKGITAKSTPTSFPPTRRGCLGSNGRAPATVRKLYSLKGLTDLSQPQANALLRSMMVLCRWVGTQSTLSTFANSCYKPKTSIIKQHYSLQPSMNTTRCVT